MQRKLAARSISELEMHAHLCIWVNKRTRKMQRKLAVWSISDLEMHAHLCIWLNTRTRKMQRKLAVWSIGDLEIHAHLCTWVNKGLEKCKINPLYKNRNYIACLRQCSSAVLCNSYSILWIQSNCWPDWSVDPLSPVIGHLDFKTFYQFLLLPGFSFYCLLHISVLVKAIIRKITK